MASLPFYPPSKTPSQLHQLNCGAYLVVEREICAFFERGELEDEPHTEWDVKLDRWSLGRFPDDVTSTSWSSYCFKQNRLPVSFAGCDFLELLHSPLAEAIKYRRSLLKCHPSSNLPEHLANLQNFLRAAREAKKGQSREQRGSAAADEAAAAAAAAATVEEEDGIRAAANMPGTGLDFFNNQKMGFGMHAHLTFLQTYEHERSYFDWAKKQQGLQGRLKLWVDYCKRLEAVMEERRAVAAVAAAAAAAMRRAPAPAGQGVASGQQSEYDESGDDEVVMERVKTVDEVEAEKLAHAAATGALIDLSDSESEEDDRLDKKSTRPPVSSVVPQAAGVLQQAVIELSDSEEDEDGQAADGAREAVGTASTPALSAAVARVSVAPGRVSKAAASGALKQRNRTLKARAAAAAEARAAGGPPTRTRRGREVRRPKSFQELLDGK